MLFNIYIFILPIILVLLFYSIYIIKFSPKKVRILGSIAIALMLARYICVFKMLVSYSILNLYMLKITYFLNFIGIPIIVFIIGYVFLRRNNINFNYVFLFSAAVIIAYIFGMINLSCVTRDISGFGYNMVFENNMIVYWIYIIFNTALLFLSIVFSGKPHVNKIGLYMLAFSAFITILEYLATIINISFFPENIFGDLCFIITCIYGITKLKNN